MLTRIVMIVMMTGTPAAAVAASHGGAHGARPLVEEFRTHPPQAAFPADSGDSLYRVARKAINDGDYRRAAALFQQLADRYPKSQYAGDALYWRAFALYRRGGLALEHTSADLPFPYVLVPRRRAAKTSVVVCFRGKPDLTLRCIHSLALQTLSGELELVLATAMRYVTPAWALKLTCAGANCATLPFVAATG